MEMGHFFHFNILKINTSTTLRYVVECIMHFNFHSVNFTKGLEALVSTSPCFAALKTKGEPRVSRAITCPAVASIDDNERESQVSRCPLVQCTCKAMRK